MGCKSNHLSVENAEATQSSQFTRYLNSSVGISKDCKRITPIALFGILFVSLNFQTIDFFGIKVSDLATLLIALISLLFFRIEFKPVLAVICSFYLACVYIPLTLLSIDTDISIIETVRYILSVMTLLVTYQLCSIIKLNRLFSTIKWLHIIFLGVVIFFYQLEDFELIQRITYVMPDLPRRQAFMLDPNYLCYWVITVTIFIIQIASSYRVETKKITIFILYCFTAYVTLSTFSRAGYLYLGLLSLQFLYFVGKSIGNWIKFFIPVVIIAAICLYINSSDIYFLDEILKRQELESQSGEIRYDIWLGGLNAFFENPLGYGPGTFSISASKFSGIEADAHNTLLWVLVNNGVFGILFFLVFVAYVFRLLAKFNAYILFGTTFFSMVLTFDTFRNFYFIIGLVLWCINENCRNTTHNNFRLRTSV